jgi:glyoxylase-like metal-dependent hydrolase (beta-lactamase superfamily II)
MKRWGCIGLAALALGAVAAATPGIEPSAGPAPRQVAKGMWWVPGGIRPNRQPDGNSVVFEVPAGLVVVDTGRHAWHRESILALARERGKPVVAIVNTHWHLDHVSGNPVLRSLYPDLRVYASGAIDGALTGFFPASARESAPYADDPQVPPEMREDIRGDLLAIENGQALKPDVVIAASQTITLGGQAVRINLARDAATAGDLWMYDESRRVAVLGDLVTLPAPFMDTACPDGWRVALGEIAGTPFVTAVPGHGAPMSQPQFALYREAFDAFIECSASVRPEEECASRWAGSIQPLLGEDPLETQQAQRMAKYYAGMLRANGGRSKYCAAAAD